MQTITLRVDEETAQAFEAADEDMRRKMAALFRICVREITDSSQTLDDVRKKMSAEAKAKGLTPEILASILNDD